MAIARTTAPTQCKVCGLVLSSGLDLCLYCAATIKAAESKPESDPNGIDQHAPGAKLDAGKPRVALMMDGFAHALLEVAKVTTYGANKYSEGGWQHVENGEPRYRDALMRHYLDLANGDIDDDSGLELRAQVAWCALAVLELYLRGKQPIL